MSMYCNDQKAPRKASDAATGKVIEVTRENRRMLSQPAASPTAIGCNPARRRAGD